MSIDRLHQLAHTLELAIIFGADNFFYDGTQHKTSDSVNSQATQSRAGKNRRKDSPCKHDSNGRKTDSGEEEAILNTIVWRDKVVFAVIKVCP